ncbi:MAG: leucyl aminopeptidase [Planctomycetes bacterium]|jgi:leucyl aminopeptidase|nr:leucyl aminopeptidase [Planctomycetota bacterium]
MEIYVRRSRLEDVDEPVLVLFAAEGTEAVPPPLAGLDALFAGLLGRVITSGEFRGSPRETRVLDRPGGDHGPGRILLVGLGKAADLDPEALRRAAGEAAVAGRALRTGRIAFALPLAGSIPVTRQAQAIVEAACLALYEFPRYRSTPEPGRVAVTAIALVGHGDTGHAEIEAGVSVGRLGAECASLARDLGNTHAGEATPSYMAERAREIASAHDLALTVLERADMETRGMGGILGVARGSAEPPKLVVLEHQAGRTDLPTVCLVGKGITFDSGGISLKPGENMDLMKYDKAGACVVLAAMKAVAVLKLPLRVVGIAPFTENMPSGSAYHPGDVLRTMNGKTIEVLNTDAEGRLILADALAMASTFRPSAIVDLATLTGACVVALGIHCAGLLSTDDTLAARLVAAGEATGERLWRLPLFPDYREQIRSPFADMKNIGGKEAGAITAACLLREFTGDLPWAHLDIAGVSWREKERDYLRRGGTGFGVRLLIEFLRNFRG